jgi:hypothetical protein
MSPQIETLKTELREFIELSETITPGKWTKEASRAYCADECITYNVVGPPSDYMYLQEESDATFIARSRNISPTMAKMLLEVIEINECRAVWIAPCKAFSNGTPDNTSASTIQAILNRWNETK